MTTVEIRTTGPGGITTRTFDLTEVPAEVEFLLSTGKSYKIEARVVGTEDWIPV